MSRRIAALVVTGIVLLASPVLAQAPTEPPSTRASVLDAARGALTSQSVPPERSKVDKALSWYDNQYVLDKDLQWMERHPHRGR